MAQAYLSLEKAKQSVRDAVANSKSGTRNAMDWGGRCVYTNVDGHHCIVGQVLEDNGIPLPDPRAGTFCSRFDNSLGVAKVYIDKGYMSEETARFLGSVQRIFDVGVDDITPTWRQALAICEKEGLL